MRAISKEGDIICVQKNTDSKHSKMGALEPGKPRPVLTQVGTSSVDEKCKNRRASRAPLLHPTVDHKRVRPSPPYLHLRPRILIESLQPKLDVPWNPQLPRKHLPQLAPWDPIVSLLQV